MAKNDKEDRKKSQLGRRVLLFGTINEINSKEVVEKMLELEVIDPTQAITLLIDSYGGFIDSMFTIIDVMIALHPPVRTVAVGKAMSAAAVILSCGAVGERYCTPSARILIHQVFGFSMGSASEVEIEAKEIVRLQKEICRLFAKNTGKSQKRIVQDIANPRYMTAEEALKYGLVDKILTTNLP